MRPHSPAHSFARTSLGALAALLIAAPRLAHAAAVEPVGPVIARVSGVRLLRAGAGRGEAMTVADHAQSAASVAKPAAKPAGMGGIAFDYAPAGSGGRAGTSVATAGDVDGDGYSDLLVGEPLYTNGETNEGRVRLFRGGPNGFATTPSWTYESDDVTGFLGWSVAPAGDVNGDGYADVIVGAPYWSGPIGFEGRAYVFLGGPSGLASTPVWTLAGPNAGSSLGFSVNTAGDVDGDGYDDVIVGAPYADTPFGTSTGLAFVVRGGPAGPTGAPIERDGDVSGWSYGYSVSTAGDVDADGLDDVVVGWPLAEGASFTSAGGRALVYRGTGSGLSTTASATYRGVMANEQLGWSVAGAGDTNGDGYADVVIGAPGFIAVLPQQGAVLLFAGGPGPLQTSPVFTDFGPVFSGAAPGARYGEAVAPAGDVNGDGFADFVVGGPHYSLDAGPNADEGCCGVYQGTSGPSYAVLVARRFGSATPGGRLGTSVCAAGDGDADGFGDVVVGEPFVGPPGAPDGHVQVFAGGADMPQAVPGWQLVDPAISVTGVGDLNGDGISDLVEFSGLENTPRSFIGIYAGAAGGPSLTPTQTLSAAGVDGDATFSSSDESLDANGDGYEDLLASTVSADLLTRHWCLLSGGAAGLATTPYWSLATPATGDSAVLMRGVGDVNADGFADAMVVHTNRLELRLGGPSGFAASGAWVLALPLASGSGNSVLTVGDYDGDGHADVAVSEALFTQTLSQQGRVRVFLGSASGLATTPALTLLGPRVDAQLQATSGLGDLNGDGDSDFGCVEYDPGSPGLFANPRDLVAVYGNAALPVQVIPDPDNTYGYQWTAAASDVDLDGYSDVLALGFTKPGLNYAATEWVLRGSPTGVVTAPAWHYTRADINSLVAWNQPGDFNGDGFPDPMLLTFPLANYATDISYGGGAVSGVGSHSRAFRQFRNDLSAPIALLGRSDATDAFQVLAQGRSAAGRARVRLESEVHPWGVAFDVASRAVTGWQRTSLPAPNTYSLFDFFAQPRPGLASDTRYKWRERVATHSPYFPWTPWLTPVANGRQEADLRTKRQPADVALHAGPRTVALAAPSPNPTRGASTLRFSLASAGEVSLVLLDVSGRRVATVARGVMEAGAHEARWNGRGADGSPVAEGVYFAKLTTPDGDSSRRLVVLH